MSLDDVSIFVKGLHIDQTKFIVSDRFDFGYLLNSCAQLLEDFNRK